MSTTNEQDADRRVNPPLRLHPGQQVLTPEQEAEARRFAQAWMAAQLSTEPVNEGEAEHWLRLACQQAEIPPPQEIVWLDSPLQVVWLWSSPSLRPVVWASAQDHVQASRWDRVKRLPVILEENGFPSWGTRGGESLAYRRTRPGHSRSGEGPGGKGAVSLPVALG